MTQTQRILDAATAKSNELGIAVCIVVLDAGANLKAFVRMDGAYLGSIDVAMKKAKSAALFESPSEALWDFVKPGGTSPGLELTNEVLVTFAGGLPLKATSGVTVGAVGVSGGQVSQDSEIAQAGAKAFSA
ncbi:heme-binding protein [Micromonospora sp. NPDC051227]|uniref:heme-binding protein n=1 Tax=Micromonospora sp. NPDC051227 TaxID=3364285 RepID=UPI00378A7936